MKKLSSPPLTGSLSEYEGSTNQRQAEYATERARLLFGCYRRGDANDPDTYAAAVAAVLSEYSADCIRSVTDPRTGIQSTSQFLPTVAEVKAACEEYMAPVRRDQERERRYAATRALLVAPVLSKYEEAKLASATKSWLERTDPKAQQLAGEQRKPFPAIPPAQLRAMAGDQWDKIPNVKDYDFSKPNGGLPIKKDAE